LFLEEKVGKGDQPRGNFWEFVESYHTIFQCQGMIDAYRLVMHTCIILIPQKVSHKQEILSNKYLTQLKLMKYLMVMVDDESPKLNGFFCFDFKTCMGLYWDLLD
jgi:hypothetical protein